MDAHIPVLSRCGPVAALKIFIPRLMEGIPLWWVFDRGISSKAGGENRVGEEKMIDSKVTCRTMKRRLIDTPVLIRTRGAIVEMK